DPDPEVVAPPDPILLGSALARSLNLRVGEDVQLMVPQGMITPMGIVPRQRLLRVVGIFELGFHEFDANYGLLPLDVAQQLLNMPGPQAMQLRVAHLDDAPEIAAELQEALGLDYTAQDWTVLNAPLYEALRL